MGSRPFQRGERPLPPASDRGGHVVVERAAHSKDT